MQPERSRISETAESNDLFDSEADETNDNDSSYNQLLFFDFECIQENGTHIPNLCVVHDEAGNEHVFQGENTKDDFCEWLFQKDNAGSIVIISRVMTVISFHNICIRMELFQRSLCVGRNFLRFTCQR